MTRSAALWPAPGLIVALLFTSAGSACADDELADKAYKILEKHCYDCHGADFQHERLNVLKRDSLLVDRGQLKMPYVSPGKPSESKIYEAIINGRMPMDAPNLKKDEQDTLRMWIEAGAAFPEVSREVRPFISERAILQLVRDDLRNITVANGKAFTRYFSIAHLHNNPQILAIQLRYTRAALSKAINSMSRSTKIVLPRAIDEHQTIFALNLQDVRWDDVRENLWGAVLQSYPYGVKPTTDVDAFEMHREIIDVFRSTYLDNVAYVRADWFVDAATRPPLYHKLTGIPETLHELTHKLGIDIERNLTDAKVVRGAVFKSGVSAQNRLMDRHPLDRGGAFWLSYDFAANSGLSNVARFPLGPSFDRNPYKAHAFREAGSEVIYELPNGLHGYMIVDDKGKRIDRAPVNIVWNKANASFNPEVVNGVSCLGCHTHGIKSFKDVLWKGHALNDGQAISFLRNLIPDNEDLEKDYLEPDKHRYLRYLEEATGPFLKVGEDADKDIEHFPEPISKVVMQYSQPLDLVTAACESGVEDVNRLKYANLRKIGLGVLEKGGVIQRTFWAPSNDPVQVNAARQVQTTVSIFEMVINLLDQGAPTKG